MQLRTTARVIRAIAQGRKRTLLCRNHPIRMFDVIQLVTGDSREREFLEVRVRDVGRISEEAMILQVEPLVLQGTEPETRQADLAPVAREKDERKGRDRKVELLLELIELLLKKKRHDEALRAAQELERRAAQAGPEVGTLG